MRLIKNFMDGKHAYNLMGSDELNRHMPSNIVEDSVDYEQRLHEHLKGELEEVSYCISMKNFDRAAEIIETSYKSRRVFKPGLFEHQLLQSELLHYANQGDYGKNACEEAEKWLEGWYNRTSDSPFAAALYAQSLHSHGFAYRGTDYADAVTDEGWEKLEEYTQRAADVMARSGSLHSEHWFWRETLLKLSISDFRGQEDHEMRFKLAVEAQPYNTDLWCTYAHQLLPRWYGSIRQIRKLANAALNHFDGDLAKEAYLKIYKMVVQHEGSALRLFSEDELLREIADEKAKSNLDDDLTTAVSLYAETRQFLKAFEVLQRMETLYMGNWTTNHSVDWVGGMGLQKAKRAQAA